MNGILCKYYDGYLFLQSWQDIKCAAKGKAASLSKDMSHTGGGPPVVTEISDFQRRVVNIIGTNAIHGHPEIEESVIIFDDVSFQIIIKS
jgi:hypothetical protein